MNDNISTRRRLWAVVPAAGLGQRMQSQIPKQYLRLQGKTVLEHSLERLLAFPPVHGLVLALHPGDHYWEKLAFHSAKPLFTVTGGETRSQSVHQALLRLARELASDSHAEALESNEKNQKVADHDQLFASFEKNQKAENQADVFASFEKNGKIEDWVMVHDAARPCVTLQDLAALWQQVTTHPLQPVGGILALPMSDTVKQGNDQQQIIATIPRDPLWRAQTPQLFRFSELYQAISQVLAQGLPITDEAGALEHYGEQPLLVVGRHDNIKITHPEDLVLAEAILDWQAKVEKSADFSSEKIPKTL